MPSTSAAGLKLSAMRTTIRATALLSVGSIVTVLAGLATAKVNALTIGPSGVGLFALLQSVVGMGGIVAGVWLSASIVRFGAVALATADPDRLARIWRAGQQLVAWVGIPASGALWLARESIAIYVIGGVEYSSAVGWVAPAVLVSALAGLDTAMINAHHRIDVLTKVTVITALAQAAIVVTAVLTLGRGGLPLAVLGGSIASLAVARPMRVRHIAQLRRVPESVRDGKTLRELLRFGVPYAMSSASGAGAMMLLPIVVVRLFDDTHVGYTRAASAIAVTYVGFLLTAMGQDYFPRLAAASTSTARTVDIANKQLETLFLISMPLVFFVMAAAPVVVPLLYAESFVPAVVILEWQLVGDVFKLTSWTLAFLLLAHGRSGSYLITESLGGSLIVGLIFVSMKLIGIEGFGLGYAIAYALYCAVVYVIVRSRCQFRFTRRTSWMFAIFSISVLLAKLSLSAIGGSWTQAIPLVLAFLFGLNSLFQIARQWR